MLFLLLISLALPSVQNQSPSKAEQFDDHAIVTPRRTERTIGKGEDRSTDVMLRPIVTGLRSDVQKKIRKELELKRLLRDHYHFYKHKLFCDLDYEVTYNRNHILSLTFSWNAYFADHERAMSFDLRDGSLITLENLFREDQIPELVKLVDQKLQAELEQMLRDAKESADLLKYAWKVGNPSLKITSEDLADFVIDDKGITFYYDPHFYHVSAWAEPEGHYFCKYSELKDFLKPSSVVWQFVE